MGKLGETFKLTDDNTALQRAVLCASEFCGTAILVFLGCMSCAVGVSEQTVPHQQISLAFGIAVLISLLVFGHISGSHINPILTITAIIVEKVALIEFPVYFVGQFAGAFAGYALLMGVTPTKYQAAYKYVEVGNVNKSVKVIGICSPALQPDVTAMQGLFTEFLLSLLLVWICCGIWDRRNDDKHDSVPVKFGLAVAGLALAGGPYTGSNMNPVRSFAPAAWHGDWKDHWLYWVGPFLSSFVGAGFYRLIFSKPKPREIVD